METIVIDVSACMPWCCLDEATDDTRRLLASAALYAPFDVPSLWPWEIMSAVSVAVKRKRITTEDAQAFLAKLAKFNIQVHPPPGLQSLNRLSSLAAEFGLTIYDVSYLDLALQLNAPLATFDSALRKAAGAAGVRLVA